MNTDNKSTFYNRLLNDLTDKSLGTVFSELRDYIYSEHLELFYTQLENIEISYKYMLQYFEQGAHDSKRDEIYNDIAMNLIYLIDSIKRNVLSVDNSSIYYNRIRYYKMNNLTLNSALERRNEILDKISLFRIAENSEMLLNNEYKNLENIENDIFSLIFILPQKDKEGISIVSKILNDENEEGYLKELIISALTLSCLEFFDEDKLTELYHIYNYSESPSEQIKSFIGIYLILQRHNGIIKFSNKINELNINLIENKSFDEDLKTTVLQFIKSSDTERITKKTHEDLINKINKLSPSIYRKIKGIDTNSNEEDDNPDWQKILEESGIDEKVKELSEMQMEGADILMGTFSSLKHFNFFQQIMNWFMPFHENHYLIQQNKEFQKLLNLLNKTGFICDSDKYSFILAANSAPEMEKKMMISQLESQNIELQELALSELQTDKKLREKHIILYIQNLYRFYKLFNRAKDFKNPFKLSPFINESVLVKSDNSNNELLKVSAEFYFKRKYYDNSISLYNILIENGNASFDSYQKLGLCYQNKECYEDALICYNKADILSSDNSWTLRHIAACYKSLGHLEKALIYYKKAESVDPDNLKLLMLIGNNYLELNKPKEALKYYYKIDYMGSNSDKVVRLILWCEFLVDNHERSLDAFNRIKEFVPEDYLNLGHLYLVKGEIKDAISAYRKCLSLYNCDIDKFKTEFFSDSTVLLAKNVKKNTLSIVYDTVLN